MNYSNKYGIITNKTKEKEYHKSRRMFAIKDNILYIADEGLELSHAEWFEMMGWITIDNDKLMEEIVRGYVDYSGIYFYKGFDFRIDEESEKIFFLKLDELIKKLNLDNNLKIYGGMHRQGNKFIPNKGY